MTRAAPYRKGITALVGSVLTWAGVAVVPDGTVDRGEWFALAIALATAAGVHGIANGVAPEPKTEPEIVPVPVPAPTVGATP